MQTLILTCLLASATTIHAKNYSITALSDLPNDLLFDILNSIDTPSIQSLSLTSKPLHALVSDKLSVARNLFLSYNASCGYEVSKALHPSLGLFTTRKPSEINIDFLSEPCLLSIQPDISLFSHIKRISLAETHSTACINALTAFVARSSVTDISIALDVNVHKNLTARLQDAINQSKVRHMTLLNLPFTVPLFTHITSLSIPPAALLSSVIASFPSLYDLLQGIQDFPYPLATRSFTSETLEPLTNESELFLTLLTEADELFLTDTLSRSSINTLNLIVKATPSDVKELIRSRKFKTIRIRFDAEVTKTELAVWARGLAKRIRNLNALEIRQVNSDVRVPKAVPLHFLKTARWLNHLSIHSFLSLRAERRLYRDNNVNALLNYVAASKVDRLELDLTFHNDATLAEFVKFIRSILKRFKGNALNFRTRFRMQGDTSDFYAKIIGAFKQFKGARINGVHLDVFIDGLDQFSRTAMACAAFTVSF